MAYFLDMAYYMQEASKMEIQNDKNYFITNFSFLLLNVVQTSIRV